MSSEMPNSFGTDRHSSSPPIVTRSWGLSITDWIALVPLALYLIPLALYLTQPRLAHRLIGRTALAGCVPASLFPDLGILGAMIVWLRDGARHMELPVTKRRPIIWNSSKFKYQDANIAASDILTQYAMRTAEKIDIPHNLEEARAKAVLQGTERSDKVVKGDGPRRRRMLYIINCTLKTDAAQASMKSPWDRILGAVLETAIILGLVLIAVIPALLRMNGTAAALIISAMFRVVRLSTPVRRPLEYMNSKSNNKNTHKLVSDNPDANTWYLYTGPRGVVDMILNKSMISVASPLGRKDCDAAAALALGLLPLLVHLQFVTMIHVAANRGQDALGLLAVVLLARWLDQYLYSEDRLAERWLRAEGVRMKAFACQFSNLEPIVGAVHVLERPAAGTEWVDNVLVLETRRDIWLSGLREHYTPTAAGDDDNAVRGRALWQTGGQDLTNNDRIWVEDTFALTCAAVDAVKAKLGWGNM